MKYNFEIMEDIKTLMSLPWKEQVMYLAEHGAEERFIRALIRTLPESEWSVLENAQTPPVVRRAINTLYWEDGAFARQHEIKEQPKYRPVDEVLADFHGTGKKQAARKELQVRLPYLTAYEQKQIIYAFLDTYVKTDRMFVLKYLDTHFDPMYMKAVEVVWGLHHDFEAAKVLTHYASDEFIAENFEQIVPLVGKWLMKKEQKEAEGTAKFILNLDLKADKTMTYNIDASMEGSQQGFTMVLPVNMAFEGASLIRLPFMFPILWSLGELGFIGIILRFYLEDERTKPLFKTGNWDEIRASISAQLEEDGFFTCYDVLDPDRKPEDIVVDDADDKQV